MNIEIKDARLLLPALVYFTQNGKDYNTFVYIDQARKDVIIPDTSEIADIAEFKQSFLKYYNSKNPVPKTPMFPSGDIFAKVNPDKFKGDFNG